MFVIGQARPVMESKMYIVQINNPERHSWRKLEDTKCEFRSLDKAISLYRFVKASPQYQGLNVRIWHTEADHRVEVENKYVVHAPNRLNGKPQIVEASSASAACTKYAKANDVHRFDCIAIEQTNDAQPSGFGGL
jgi:hypothetical protein